jgi:hypothetical protein
VTPPVSEFFHENIQIASQVDGFADVEKARKEDQRGTAFEPASGGTAFVGHRSWQTEWAVVR